jgi:hypothetical protein
MCTSNLRETDFNADVLSALLSDDTPLFLAIQAVHSFNTTVVSTPVHNRDELLQQVLYETRTRWEDASNHVAFEELISMRASVDAGLYWDLFVLCCTGNDIVPLLTPTLCLALYKLETTDVLTSVTESFEKVSSGKKNWSLAKRQATLLNLCHKAASAARAQTPTVSTTSAPLSPVAVANENPAAATVNGTNSGATPGSWAAAAGNTASSTATGLPVNR